MFVSVYFLLIEFLFNFFFQNDDQLLIIKFHEILTVFFSHEHLQRKSTFLIPPQIFSVCGGSKNFFIPPKIFSVCGGFKN